MEPVICLTVGFISISLFWRKLKECLELFFLTNLKYQIIDFLANYIYYGSDIGIEASLKLDYPSKDIFERRLIGHQYLESKLGGGKYISRANSLAQKIVDCRFALAKLLMPLLRELEFPSKCNFICKTISMTNNHLHKHSDSNLLQVVTEHGNTLSYVGNDAVHTLGVLSFYAPLQREINHRMSLHNRNLQLRYTPISLTSELEKNVNLVLNLTRMDKVRYCLSGSEAIYAAFKDIMASSRDKKIIVRFKSAYHGHVSGVDFLNCGSNHIFLTECSTKSIEFIERYHYRIAAVFVNPMQHFTGLNKPSPPGEKLTISNRNRAIVTKEMYARWLHTLMEKCNYCSKYLTKVTFVIDDIYFAFRTPELFSTNYFTHPSTGAPLIPNVLVIGKGVAAGYPLSMVLGQKGYLNFDDNKFFQNINQSKDTLSAWHGGIVASNVFLEAIDDRNVLQLDVKEQYFKMLSRCSKFCEDLNKKYEESKIPLRIRNFSNTFSIDYLNISLYNSRYPQYLMAESVYLGNYSTGKFNLNADATEVDLESLGEKFIQAGIKMQKHGYFEPYGRFVKNKIIFSLVFKFVINYYKIYYHRIIKDKMTDVDASVQQRPNKFCHFCCSVFIISFVYPYIIMGQYLKGFLLYFVSHIIRHSSYAFDERQENGTEKFKFRNTCTIKKKYVLMIMIAVLVYYMGIDNSRLSEFFFFPELSPYQYFTIFSVFTIISHYLRITYQSGLFCGISCGIKDVLSPLTYLIKFTLFSKINRNGF